MRTLIRAIIFSALALGLAWGPVSRAAEPGQAQLDAECFVVFSVTLSSVQSPKYAGAFFYYGAKIEQGRSDAEIEALVKAARDRVLKDKGEHSDAIAARCSEDLAAAAHRTIGFGAIATDRSSQAQTN